MEAYNAARGLNSRDITKYSNSKFRFASENISKFLFDQMAGLIPSSLLFPILVTDPGKTCLRSSSDWTQIYIRLVTYPGKTGHRCWLQIKRRLGKGPQEFSHISK